MNFNLIITCLFLLLSLSVSYGDHAPVSIKGSILEATITNGVYPFAGYGRYQIVFHDQDYTYIIKPLSPNISPSTGTYSYSKKGYNNPTIQLNDSSLLFIETQTLVFTDKLHGNYTATSSYGGNQSGTFVVNEGLQTKTIFSNAMYSLPLGKGWFWNKLGFFYHDFYPFIFLFDYPYWLYCVGDNETSYYAFDFRQNLWLWMSRDFYPHAVIINEANYGAVITLKQ